VLSGEKAVPRSIIDALKLRIVYVAKKRRT
jgi:hypothetical protein